MRKGTHFCPPLAILFCKNPRISKKKGFGLRMFRPSVSFLISGNISLGTVKDNEMFKKDAQIKLKNFNFSFGLTLEGS